MALSPEQCKAFHEALTTEVGIRVDVARRLGQPLSEAEAIAQIALARGAARAEALTSMLTNYKDGLLRRRDTLEEQKVAAERGIDRLVAAVDELLAIFAPAP